MESVGTVVLLEKLVEQLVDAEGANPHHVALRQKVWMAPALRRRRRGCPGRVSTRPSTTRAPHPPAARAEAGRQDPGELIAPDR